MKKLIALFAILVAATTMSFATPSNPNDDDAQIAVYVYKGIDVDVWVHKGAAGQAENESVTCNVLTGSTTNFFYQAKISFDAAWVGGLTGAWTFTKTSAFGSWTTPAPTAIVIGTGGNASVAPFLVAYTAGANSSNGYADTFDALFTVSYSNF